MKNIIYKKQYKVGIGAIALVLTLSLAMWASYAYGEQVGGAPESNSTSYIQTLYTDLEDSNFGSDSADPNWGTYWNRLKTAAQWIPDGTAVSEDIVSGKTFSNYDRTQQTGTYAPGNCPTQQYHDSYVSATWITNCDDFAWTVPSDNITGTEFQDPRSGLIWSSAIYRSMEPLIFSTIAASAFSWDASAAMNGGETAITLCSGMGDGWRLPTQKELMQAYVDGSRFYLSQMSVVMWSATENSSSLAWNVTLGTGRTNASAKTTVAGLRCVR